MQQNLAETHASSLFRFRFLCHDCIPVWIIHFLYSLSMLLEILCFRLGELSNRSFWQIPSVTDDDGKNCSVSYARLVAKQELFLAQNLRNRKQISLSYSIDLLFSVSINPMRPQIPPLPALPAQNLKKHAQRIA